MTALVGPSGAGKTTLTALVARLYDPTTGSIRVGGMDLRDATLESVSETIGVVSQEAHLFHDTIRENLLFARPEATEDELLRALEDAQIIDLVRSLPSGLDTVVGDRGHRLSGGEKQRLAIARLLLKAPSVVVLDEATAHLDSSSEAAVQRALDTALQGRTAIVIAHRLSTVRGADQILVLEDGGGRGSRHAPGAPRAWRPVRPPVPHPVRRRYPLLARGARRRCDRRAGRDAALGVLLVPDPDLGGPSPRLAAGLPLLPTRGEPDDGEARRDDEPPLDGVGKVRSGAGARPVQRER